MEDTSPESQAYTSGGRADQQSSDEGRIPKVVGLRDRIGCYTWTWFTMTMATGGIANVLHSSNDTQTISKFCSDSLQFHTDPTG